MRNSYIRLAAALGMVLSAAPPALPQTSEISVFKINVQSDSGAPLSRYSAGIYDRTQQETASTSLGFDNTFEFQRVPSGQYLLVVRDERGETVDREFVSATAFEGPVTIRLPKKDAPQPPAGPVSVAELRHPPARKAYQAAAAAQKLARAGEFEKAAQQFQKAIDISPDYALAYSGLAASHLRTGQNRQAASEASRAMELSQANPADLCMLAQAQIQLGRIAEATATVRRWLAMAPENPKAHWVLGLLLAQDRHTLAEAARHLERAAQEEPAARPSLEMVRRALASMAISAALVAQPGAE